MLNKNHKFRTEKQSQKGGIKQFVLAFLAFALVFGSLSAVVIIKHNNISLKSIFGGEDATSVSDNGETTEVDLTQPIGGSANFLIYCNDSTNGEFYFIAVVTADMDNRIFTVRPIQTDNPEYLTALKTGGSFDLKDAVEKTTGLKIDKYIASDTETCALAINYMGGLEYSVDNRVEYRTDDSTLILTQGNQTIKGDSLVKYFRYCNTLGVDGLRTQGKLIAAMLDSYINEENVEKGVTIYQKLLAKINSDSDISYIEAAKGIDMLNT